MLFLRLLVFVFGVVCGSLEPQHGDAEGLELLRCDDRLNGLEHFVSRQNNLFRVQEGRLSHQENLIRQLDAKLSQQEANYDNLLSEFSQLQLQLRGRQQFRHDDDTAPKALAGRREGTPTAHDAQTRSDDSGPLEAVVAQLSQRVNEIQALQSRTIADVGTLKTTTITDIQTLQASNSRQDLDIRDASTSTFVQWGSSTCAANSTLIYSGVLGGSDYRQSGSAANYLCLTLSPVLMSTSSHVSVAYLYGGEYETGDSHQNMDPVCAVCRSAFATTVLIPGTNVCTPGWHKQYSGYLMAGYYGHAAASEYICVDSKLESSNGSGDNHNGKLLYRVKTRCGSLPCTPYANDKFMTCAVCSK